MTSSVKDCNQLKLLLLLLLLQCSKFRMLLPGAELSTQISSSQKQKEIYIYGSVCKHMTVSYLFLKTETNLYNLYLNDNVKYIVLM